MREIKFKAWHIERKQMFWFDVMRGNHGRGNGYIGMVDWGKEYHNERDHRGNVILIDPENCELMQFTGLLDKGGNEIYEGDIITSYHQLHNPKGNTYKVDFAFGSFRMQFISGGYRPKNGFVLAYDFNLEVYEIIGNIYEHPHLLSNEKDVNQSS